MTNFTLQILGVACILSLAAPLFAEPIALRHLPAFVIVALLSAIGHFCLIMALSLAPAAVIQPFTYLVIIYAFMIGYVALGEIPGPATIIGGLIIAGAGIFALRHEHRRSSVRLKE